MMRNELSRYVKVCSIFFSFCVFDRRNSFRPINALGRVIGQFGWVISYRACHLDVVVFVLFYGIFIYFSRFFLKFITN